MAPLAPRGPPGSAPPPGPPPGAFHPGAPPPRPAANSNGYGPPQGQAGPSTLASPMTGADASTTVFVGSITPGISDSMLQQLLNTCGQLVTLKRISPAFGFATFDHPEAVIRAIDFLNGLELPPPGVVDKGEAASKTKKLVVKADEKTKAFVETYKANRNARASAEDDLDAAGKVQIQGLIDTLKRPDALALFPDSSSAHSSAVPAHLKDLPPEDVPEEHRTSVLSEIDKFRQASAAREEEKRHRERAIERERQAALHRSSGYGDGRSDRAGGHDPQSFVSGAPAFVKPSSSSSSPAVSSQPAADMDPEEADELEEQRRRAAKRKDEERRANDALAAYTHRERTRLSHWSRVIDDSSAETQREEKAKAQLVRRTEEWNDEAEHGRELFYVDRTRWRHFRGPMLRREMEEDEADAKREAEEQKKAEEEARKFLERQEEEMKKHLEEQRKAGVLVADGTAMQPLKLKMATGAPSAGAGAASNPSGSSAQAPSASNGNSASAAAADGAPAVPAADFRMEEDDEDADGAAGRRRRGLKVNLSDGMTPEERQTAVQAKRAEVRSSMDGLDAIDLYARTIKWDWVDEALITSTLAPRISAAITDAVGEAVPELAELVLEKIRAHEEAKSIEEAVEPVLAEDAESFTAEIWKALVEESTVASSGLVV
ncbi:unnamed protein product [Parajaminaea phylloscopi]